VPISQTLKAEIDRLVQKEAKARIAKARLAAIHYRRENAQLRRLLRQREREIRAIRKQAGQLSSTASEGEPLAALAGVRFSAKSVRSQRERLGLSADDYAKLIGVTPLSIRHWEGGVARPRKAQLAALVAVRGIGKREALKRLSELE
jgi:DNA-binding transcriptional regulator YiaG